jgi:putative hemolysin
MTSRLAEIVRAVPGLGSVAEEVAFIAVVALVSYFSLVLGELVPKSIALKHPEGYALLAGGPLLILSALVRPLVWGLTKSSNLVLQEGGRGNACLASL